MASNSFNTRCLVAIGAALLTSFLAHGAGPDSASDLAVQDQAMINTAFTKLTTGSLDSAGQIAFSVLNDSKKLAGNPNAQNLQNVAHEILKLIELRRVRSSTAAATTPSDSGASGAHKSGGLAASVPLLKALLQSGNKDAVLKYINENRGGSINAQMADRWATQIKNNQVPAFDADISSSLNAAGTGAGPARCEVVTEQSVDCDGRHYVRAQGSVEDENNPVQQISNTVPGTSNPTPTAGSGAAVNNGQ